MAWQKGKPLAESTKALLREANRRRLEDPEERERARAQMLHALSCKRRPVRSEPPAEVPHSPLILQLPPRPFDRHRIMLTGDTMPMVSHQPMFSVRPTAPLPEGWGLRRHLPGTGGADWWTGGFVETTDERGRPATVPAFGPAHEARPFTTEAAARDFQRFERPLRGLAVAWIA